MDRNKITSGLSAMLERDFSIGSALWSKEVSIESLGRIRPDYVTVHADWGKFASLSDIESAKFTVYEVKSCLADYKSGSGLNGIGDFNYIVTPYEVMRQITELSIEGDLQKDALWGWMYPYPEEYGRTPDVMNMPKYEGQVEGWKFYTIPPGDLNHRRNTPMLSILWSMIYAGIERG